MDLWEIRAEIPPEAAEATELALLESGSGAWMLLEDAIEGRAWIVGIFADRPEAEARWERLRAGLPARPRGRPRSRLLPDSDWTHSYRRHFKAWTFGRLHWVPVWERGAFRLPVGHAVLWLDPGLAFGTGNHETTRLCIERMVAFEARLGEAGAKAAGVVDAGCGSGILALSAALLGFGDVSGFDSDPEAVRVSRENAEVNGLSDRVRFRVADLASGLDGAQANVVLANLQSDVLCRHARELTASVIPGGMLELGGILAAEGDSVREAFAALVPGWSLASRALGEWCDICLVRPADGETARG
jgi:ribosomal protein L11 methyltransferase